MPTAQLYLTPTLPRVANNTIARQVRLVLMYYVFVIVYVCLHLCVSVVGGMCALCALLYPITFNLQYFIEN